VKSGMILPGIVNNITNFGCFVDIGVKESVDWFTYRNLRWVCERRKRCQITPARSGKSN
jgi:hypothetical protein